MDKEKLTKQEKQEIKWRKQDEKYFKKVNKKRENPKAVNFLLAVPKVFSKILKGLIAVCSVLIIVSIITASIIYVKFEPMIKEVRNTEYDKLINCNESTFQLLSNTLIYDNKNKVIGEINAGNFIHTNIEDVSKYVTDGYIAVEDKNFKTHFGIDVVAITRAGLKLVKNDGEITQGASTITQQVVKNNLLSSEKTYTRKITEMLLAIDIEKEFSKSQIMEFYVNTNFYGHNCYGIEAASRYYFDTTANKLTPAQAAILIGLSNAPSLYDPVNNYDKAIENQHFILKTMYTDKVITKEQYEDALNEKIEIVQKEFETKTSTSYQVTYALHCATLQLMKDDGFSFKYTFKNKSEQTEYEKEYVAEYDTIYTKIRSGGYKIHTSLNSSLQKKLQKTINDKLATYTDKTKAGVYKMQSAAVCIDNSTNYVVAIVGGRSKSGEYNRAYQAERQPGSSIKPVLDYGPAFDTGLYYPSLKMEDTKIEGDYSPKNANGTYSGSVSIRKAIQNSLNTVAYRTLQGIGIKAGLEYLDKLNFTSISHADNNNAAICLGGFTTGVTPIDMAKAYNTLENEGQYSDRTCIVSIEDVSHEIYDTKKETLTRIYKDSTAYMITSCLKDVILHGTGTNAKVSNQVIAGKTGTTNSNKDSWFCGYSPYYTMSIWVGYDSPQEIDSYGTSLPCKIFSDYITQISADKDNADFSIPEDVVLKYIDGSGKARESQSEIKDSVYKKTINYYSMDFFSTKKAEGLSADRISEIEKENYDIALKAVRQFEKYNISDVESAINMSSKYKEVKALVDNITDEYNKSNLLERTETRYENLNKVYSNWSSYIEEYEKKQEKEAIVEQKKHDSDSINEAKENIHKLRVSNADFYMTKLQNQVYNDETTQAIIPLLREAILKLDGYDEYKSYNKNANAIIKTAEKLPLPLNPTVEEQEDETKVNNNNFLNQ